MDATFTQDGERYTLALERRLAHPIDKVWRALTERELLKQWFPCDVQGAWQEGAPLSFRFLHGEGDGLPEDQLRGEVLEVDAPRLVVFRWGDSVLRAELEPDGDGCRLRYSESVLDPSWGARNAAGWELCLENLGLLLQGASLAKFVVQTWRARYEHYAARFEPVFGPQQDMPEDHPAATEATESGAGEAGKA